MYDAFHAGDGEAALACFDADVVLDLTRRLDGAVTQGREEMAAAFGRWIGAFEDWHQRIDEVRDLGDRVYVVLVQRGRGKGSGLETEARYATVFETRGDSITRMTLYPDPDEALQAAGGG